MNKLTAWFQTTMTELGSYLNDSRFNYWTFASFQKTSSYFVYRINATRIYFACRCLSHKYLSTIVKPIGRIAPSARQSERHRTERPIRTYLQ